MNKEIKDELWRTFIELQTAVADVDACRQAAEEDEQQRLTKACNKLNSAIGIVREAYDMIDQI